MKLNCDICGGSLLVDAGGKSATCQTCGVQYSIERIREKIQLVNSKGSVEESVDSQAIMPGVESLITRAMMFEEEDNWEKAENYYERILDMDPSNEFALGRRHDRIVEVEKEYSCIVAEKVKYGVFVDLLPSHKRALIHFSNLSRTRKTAQEMFDLLSIGDELRAKIIDIDSHGRINCMAIVNEDQTALDMTSAELHSYNNDQEDSDELLKLGIKYYDGDGVPQNYNKALEFFSIAADAGSAFANTSLGLMYTEGKGVSVDHVRAAKYYYVAAEQGDIVAQFNLGVSYMLGKGISQNYEKAVKWFQKAADQGNSDALCKLGYLYNEGLGTKRDCSKAMGYYLQAADNGSAEAQSSLGDIYCDGVTTKKDVIEGLKWYKRASENGLAIASERFEQKYQEELQLRIGLKISEGLTEEQLEEFDALTDPVESSQWLSINKPDFKQIVADEMERLKNEIEK